MMITKYKLTVIDVIEVAQLVILSCMSVSVMPGFINKSLLYLKTKYTVDQLPVIGSASATLRHVSPLEAITPPGNSRNAGFI